MKNMNNNRGFSLIELMIAVVIIGILAAIAIPNYQKYQRKSRQAEAKSTLAAIFTSEKTYIAEYGQGSSSFQAIGFGPEGRIIYNCGWGTGTGVRAPRDLSPATANDAFANTNDACGTAVANNCTNGIDDLVSGTTIASPTGAVTPANQTFTIACEAALDENNPNDQWTMDQAKTLINTSDGT